MVNLTLDHLSITGGYYGIYADQILNTAGSDHLTVSNSIDLFQLQRRHLHPELQRFRHHCEQPDLQQRQLRHRPGSPRWPDFRQHGPQPQQAGIYATAIRIQGAEQHGLFQQTDGIFVTSSNSTPSLWATASGNIVHDNSGIGINASYANLTSNTAYNQPTNSGFSSAAA